MKAEAAAYSMESSTATVPDGMYYELAYNGDKNELYMDAYKKFENRCFKM